MSAHSELIEIIRQSPFAVYDGVMPAEDATEYPYVHVQYRVPRVRARALTRQVLSRRASWLLTPAGTSVESVQVVIAWLMSNLEGARVQGQRLEAEYIEAGIEEDPDVVVDHTHVLYSKLQYSATLTN